MKKNEIVESLGVDEELVTLSISANNFTETNFSDRQTFLIKLYVDYLVARKEAEEIRNSFRYQDGEEQVDKSSVYDNYRRHYVDLLTEWEKAKREYEADQTVSGGSAFHLRKRADFLDSKPHRSRRASRRNRRY